jgi:hypothetical protein
VPVENVRSSVMASGFTRTSCMEAWKEAAEWARNA